MPKIDLKTLQPKPKGKPRGDATRIKEWQFKPGQSGNPGGRKHDYAADIAHAIFERNLDKVTRAMLTKLLSGDARTFTALADRGYGKPEQKVTLDANLDVNTDDEFRELITSLTELVGQQSGQTEPRPKASVPPATTGGTVAKDKDPDREL